MSKGMQLKARIRNLASEYGVPANIIMRNYMMERLLERISLSAYKENFILKGGVLIASILGTSSRTTMDLDLTLINYVVQEKSIKTAFSSIFEIDLGDEVEFVLKKIQSIREETIDGGVRVSLEALFGNIRTPLKVDLTAGEQITPKAVIHEIESLFGDYKFEVFSYPIETLLAEKVETVLSRGTLNTRMRDFYDIYVLGQRNFSKRTLKKALTVTSHNRGTENVIAESDGIILSMEESATMNSRWNKYIRKFTYAKGITFDQTLQILRKLIE
jgi:predicted nucleotidyltransferase component of viral defense system